MASSFPLQTLLDHSRHRMEAGERLLRILKHKEQVARQSLDGLISYRGDYQQRLTTDASGPGMDIHLLRDFHAFLAKLEVAIEHQEKALVQAEANWKKAHETWLELRRRVKAYETLAERHRRREIQREEKRDQRLTDEQAARRHNGKPAL